MLKKISITGPESSGKSELAKKLAWYYHTVYVPEYARTYLKDIGANYTISDVLKIARGQLFNELQYEILANRLLFCDTDFLVTKIWSEVVFGECPAWIEQQVKQHQYDLYLLCYPDLEWKPDPLRENPHDREQLFRLYERDLIKYNFPYAVIKGKGDLRWKYAVNHVDSLLFG